MGGEAISYTLELEGCEAVVYQILTATVPLNSHAKALCTTDYDSVKHFVTRRAPFEVYEITRPLDDGETEAGRAAFYVRLNIRSDAPVGPFERVLTVRMGDETLTVPISLKIYNICVPALADSEFHMVNWIYYDRIAKYYEVEAYSDKYMKILDAYLDNQTDMRNDYLMIPSGTPVRDGAGNVVDFDFSHAEIVGNRALEHGFKYVMGGFVAKFKAWNDPDHFLLRDRDVTVTSIEGYRQFKIYFTHVYECILRNGREGGICNASWTSRSSPTAWPTAPCRASAANVFPV